MVHPTHPPVRAGFRVGRCELHDLIDTLTALCGIVEYLYPFRHCDTERVAVGIGMHHSATTGARPVVVLLRRDRPGDRWELTLWRSSRATRWPA